MTFFYTSMQLLQIWGREKSQFLIPAHVSMKIPQPKEGALFSLGLVLAQLLSHVQLLATPQTAASRLPCPLPSRNLLKLVSIESGMHIGTVLLVFPKSTAFSLSWNYLNASSVNYCNFQHSVTPTRLCSARAGNGPFSSWFSRGPH